MVTTTVPRRLQLTRILALSLATVAAIVLVRTFRAEWNGSPQRGQSLAIDSGLIIPSESLNFGQAWDQSEFAWILPITNPKDHEIAIEGFVSSCTCLKIEPQSLVVPARQTREIQLTLDLTAKASKRPEAEWRAFDVTIRPRLEGDSENVRRSGWTVTGRVRTAVDCFPSTIDFGSHSVRSQPIPSQQLRLTRYVPLGQLSVNSQHPHFTVTQQCTTDEAICRVAVAHCKTLPLGPFTGTICLTAQLADGRELPQKRLSFSGRIVADIQAVPADVHFGARNTGDICEETITLASLTRTPFTVIEAKSEGKELALAEVPTEIPGAHVYVVKQRIAATQEQTDRVSFGLRTEGNVEVVIVVQVSYFGR